MSTLPEQANNPTRVLADIAITSRTCKTLMEAQNRVLDEQLRMLKRIRICAEIWALLGVIYIIGTVLGVIGTCLFGYRFLAAWSSLSP